MLDKRTSEPSEAYILALQRQAAVDKERIDRLEESETRYHRMLENLKDEFIFYRHDTLGKFTFVSPSYKNILGYFPDEYIGKGVASFWTDHPVNDEAKRCTELAMQGIRQPPYEMEIFHKNGTRRRFVTIETPILEENGTVTAVEGTARDITGKCKIEEQLAEYRTHLQELVGQRTIELQESKKQLSDIINFLPYPTYTISRDGTVIAWNRAMADLSGIATATVVGQKYHPYLKKFYNTSGPFPIEHVLKPSQSGDKMEHSFLPIHEPVRLSDTRGPLDATERYIENLYDGEGGYVLITTAPILDNTHQIVGAIESIRDVTRIKQAERTIRQSAQRLSTLMNNLPGMAYRIVCKDDCWKVEFVSRGSFQIFGHAPSFFIDRDINDLMRVIHPDDLSCVFKNVRKAVKNHKSFQCEYRVLSAEGQTKWVFDKAEIVMNPPDKSISVEGFMADFTAYKKMEERLKRENTLLRSTMRERNRFDNIIGNCAAMQKVFELILNTASNDDNVFITGESGTGKELVAHAIHNVSDRRKNRFVAVNCAAIPENLIESEFFGARKGAYSGAHENKKGYMEIADNGTLFLDEIGDISPMLQVKLLRAIDGGGFSPVGSRDIIRPNLRIVAATNKDVQHLLSSGAMRQDFFFRIHVIPIHLPPLRERGDDILLFINHFLKKYGSTEDITSLSMDDLETLQNYSWPGNIRELQNVIRRYLALRNLHFMSPGRKNIPAAAGKEPSLESIPYFPGQGLKSFLEQFEKQLIEKELVQNRYNKTKTSRVLGISRNTLARKMAMFGLE